MKKFIYTMMLVCLAQNVFSQRIRAPKKQLSPQEYREKSNDQLVLGSVLLIGGTGLAFLGANVQRNATLWDFSGLIIETVGIFAAGGVIPLFIGAYINHKKGKTMAFSMKPSNAVTLQKLKFSSHPFPSLSLQINF